jgi:hypothetical protein
MTMSHQVLQMGTCHHFDRHAALFCMMHNLLNSRIPTLTINKHFANMPSPL